MLAKINQIFPHLSILKVIVKEGRSCGCWINLLKREFFGAVYSKIVRFRMMAEKRQCSPEKDDTNIFESKKRKEAYEPPVNFGSATSDEEVDLKILQIKNIHLSIYNDQINTENEELKTQIKSLEELKESYFNIISCFSTSLKEYEVAIKISVSKLRNNLQVDIFEVEENTVSLIERLSDRPLDVIDVEIKETITKLISNLEELTNISMVIKNSPSVGDLKSNGMVESSSETQKLDSDQPQRSVDSLQSLLNKSLEENVQLHSKFLETSDHYAFVKKKLDELEAKHDALKFELNTTIHRLELMIITHKEVVESLEAKSTESKDTSAPTLKTETEPLNPKYIAELEELKRDLKQKSNELEFIKEQLNSNIEICEKLKAEKIEVKEEYVRTSVPYKSIENLCGIMTGEAAFQKSHVDTMRRILNFCKLDRDAYITQIQNEMEKFRSIVKQDMECLENKLEKSQEEVEILQTKLKNSDGNCVKNDTITSSEEFKKILSTYQRELEMLRRAPTAANDSEENHVISPKKGLEQIYIILQNLQSSKQSDADFDNYLSDVQKCVVDAISEKEKIIKTIAQEKESIMNDMEFTTQAFEEMRQQNLQLVDQIKENEDSHLNMVHERLRSHGEMRLMKESNEALELALENMRSLYEAQKTYLESTEENLTNVKNSLSVVEKDMQLKGQMMEIYRKKAQEAVSMYSESHHRIEELKSQLEQAAKLCIDKELAIAKEKQIAAALIEENASLKKREDRKKRLEIMGNSERLLLEEIKMYKNKLTCPCCTTNTKDAILIPCLHVFCFQCLTKRYDMRQRKCPRCNMGFGHNDFRKIYM